jgi:uncharacterized protein YjbJ (UPF0337 family)
MKMVFNRDIVAGQWKQLTGAILEAWGRLRQHASDRFKGRFRRLVGRLQEQYGFLRGRASRTWNDLGTHAETKRQFRVKLK